MKHKKYRSSIALENFLIWAYQKQKVHQVIENGVGLNEAERYADGIYSQQTSPCHAIAENARIGARCDYFGKGTIQIHPDADFVHDLIKSKSFNHLERGLIFDYAVTGMHPDAMIGARPRLVPDTKPNGKIRMVYNKSNKPVLCLLKTMNDPDHISFMRNTYTDWYNAMVKLYKLLVDKETLLTSYTVTHPRSPAKPWA
jgi:hypothetical protein